MGYSSVTVSNYNQTPPSDDGSQTSANKAKWATIKTKLSDPLKTAIESINTNVASAFSGLDASEVANSALSILTTRGDILFKGSSALQRLAKGSEGQIIRYGSSDPEVANITTVVDNIDLTNSGADDQVSVTTSGLPSWIRWADVVVEAYSQDANDDVGIQIGPSGGLVTSGYVSGRSSDAATRTTSTSHVILNNGTSAGVYTTHARLVLIDSSNNTWSISGSTFLHSNGAMYFFGGYVSLSGALERIAVKSVAGTNNFDAGVFSVSYGG